MRYPVVLYLRYPLACVGAFYMLDSLVSLPLYMVVAHNPLVEAHDPLVLLYHMILLFPSLCIPVEGLGLIESSTGGHPPTGLAPAHWSLTHPLVFHSPTGLTHPTGSHTHPLVSHPPAWSLIHPMFSYLSTGHSPTHWSFTRPLVV